MCKYWGQPEIGWKDANIGHDYNVETKDKRERWTSFFEDGISQKYTHI
jgi:hypothetical protein